MAVTPEVAAQLKKIPKTYCLRHSPLAQHSLGDHPTRIPSSLLKGKFHEKIQRYFVFRPANGFQFRHAGPEKEWIV
jgi:hypothetical protein